LQAQRCGVDRYGFRYASASGSDEFSVQNHETKGLPVSKTRILATALAVPLILLIAIDVRDIADTLGISIPLPHIPFGGSLFDNVSAVLVVVIAIALFRHKDSPGLVRLLGLGSPGWWAPLLVLLATLPNWIGLAFVGTLQTDIDFRAMFYTALLFPLAEEIVFRGFGFVFLRRALGWRILPAVAIQAIVFAWEHWYGLRGSDMAIQVFFITLVGAIVFATLDAMNRYTIWSGLVLHVSLNAAWNVYDVAPTAATGWTGNLLRIASAAIALFLLWLFRNTARPSASPITETRPATQLPPSPATPGP
jgi:hypothetical protein